MVLLRLCAIYTILYMHTVYDKVICASLNLQETTKAGTARVSRK